MEITKILKYRGATPSAKAFRIRTIGLLLFRLPRGVSADRRVRVYADSKCIVWVLWNGEERSYYCRKSLQMFEETFWDVSFRSIRQYLTHRKNI